MSGEATWLPNLVGGTSMWKLAVDLNEAKFFDGRLLVPETEGSESLPVTVRWDLTGLIPLAEARTKHPEDVAQATKDFQAALERVAKVFATPNSGFDKYKSAFTVPSLDAENGSNYFYSPEKKKLYVINWGASPRAMGGKAEYVFGFEDWAKQWADPAAIAAATGVAAAGATAAAVAQEAPKPDEAKKDDAKKKEEKKKDERRGRPWWLWPLFGILVIALVLLAIFLLKACEQQKTKDLAEAGLNLPDGATLLADGAVLLPDGAVVAWDAGEDASALADGGDAGALSDGGDAGALGDGGADGGDAGDAGAKKHKDGGADGGGDDDDDDDDTLGGGGSSGGTIVGGGGGKVIVKTFPGGAGAGNKTSVHRKHYSDDAVAWRVAGNTSKVSRTEDSGHRFDVWLNPGATFEGVRVEWQDAKGKWHVH